MEGYSAVTPSSLLHRVEIEPLQMIVILVEYYCGLTMNSTLFLITQDYQVIQPDWEINPVGDERHSGEWMQDGKSSDGQAFVPVQIPDLEQVEKVPEVGVQYRYV